MADPTHAAEMPEHWSWFSFLPEEWHEGLRTFAADTFGSPVAGWLEMGRGGDEKFFYGGRFDVLHVWGFLFILLLLSILLLLILPTLGLLVRSQPTDFRISRSITTELLAGAGAGIEMTNVYALSFTLASSATFTQT